MKDLPILMTPGNIVAIDEDRKHMTRRLLNPQPPTDKYQFVTQCSNSAYYEIRTDPRHGHGLRHCVKLPYTTGQHLYIKEPHYHYGKWVKNGLTKTKKQAWKFVARKTGPLAHVIFDPEKIWTVRKNSYRKRGWYKRSARFMPKKFARCWLEVTKVYPPEQGKDISREDAIKEGVERTCSGWRDYRVGSILQQPFLREPADSFGTLLESIYGRDALLKWYWPIEFTKIEK